MEPVHVVWFKRDLRVRDHAPLANAATMGRVLPLYVFEPELWQQPEMDVTHFQFIIQSLQELDRHLSRLGLRLHVQRGAISNVLQQLSALFAISSLHSHEEVGGRWTYDRDRGLRGWCSAQGIPWFEYRQNGVVRGLKNRDRWASKWKSWMTDEPATINPKSLLGVDLGEPARFPTASELNVRPSQDVECQEGGEDRAHEILGSFLSHRGSDYRTAMSSPRTAEERCSRLSPHIAWGCISVKQIYHAVRDKLDLLNGSRGSEPQSNRGFSKSLTSFQSRLSWHCHFMQKLDDEPELEFRNLCRVYDGMREDDFRADYFEVWCQGRTGYPMIDACMRYLHHHRWINFRMRAMLMSFAAYHLWLHWREPALFLARHFLDFEPGIHFPQVQMQSGVTGINTIRIYSPIKQAIDQDPEGDFVRRWIPELEHVPKPWIFEPWKMSIDDQVRYHCRIGIDYPTPIVEHRTAVATAKDRIYMVRRTDLAIANAQRVYEKHGSRKNRDPMPRKKSKSAPSKTQLWLPGMEEGETETT